MALDRCDWCPGSPFTMVKTPMGLLLLCFRCTQMATGWSGDTLEERHAPYRDHLALAIKRGIHAQIVELTNA